MFRRKKVDESPTPTPPAATPAPPPASTSWNAEEMRELLFKMLDQRLGKDSGASLREDFAKHIAADLVSGVEQGYICLVSKLIDYTDALVDYNPGTDSESFASTTSRKIDGVNSFTVFRKDV